VIFRFIFIIIFTSLLSLACFNINVGGQPALCVVHCVQIIDSRWSLIESNLTHSTPTRLVTETVCGEGGQVSVVNVNF